MRHYLTIFLVCVLQMALCSCDMDEAEYIVPIDLSTLTFELHSVKMGIYPDESVMTDPNNMFVEDPIFIALGDDPGFRWRSLIYADDNGLEEPQAHILAFYCWATVLVKEKTGEAQFYAATRLKAIYENELVDEATLPTVKQMALNGFYAVLEHFPDSVTYDETGTTAFKLSEWAKHHIEQLGGNPDLF